MNHRHGEDIRRRARSPRWLLNGVAAAAAGILAASTLASAGEGKAETARQIVNNEKGDIISVRQGNPNGIRRSDPGHRFQEGEILVKFRSSASDSERQATHRRLRAEILRDHKELRLQRLRLKKGMSVEEAVELFRQDPAVEYAEPNYLLYLQNTPNDPNYGDLWGLSRIQAPAAWDLTTGSSSTVVAILDTGIDYTHPDLAANLWINQSELGGLAGSDDDGNGYVDDIYGFNAVANTGNPKDDNSHGTHVSGSIGAVGNNGLGVAGVAWNVKLLSCKCFNAGGSGTTADAIECLQYVKTMKNRGVNIVATNNSWGSSGYSQSLYDAIRDQKDILFVAGAGNDNVATPFYPASYDLPNIISVAASDFSDWKASFSNYGKWNVDIAAPGRNIYSTYLGGTYANASGTSMATPHVTGLAALLKAQDASRTTPALKNLILAGGDPATAFADITVTGKRINAYKSLTCSNSSIFAVLHLPTTPQANVPQVVSAMSTTCGSAVGPVTMTPAGGAAISLRDDGIAPDEVAGDGIFTGTWTPASSTVTALTFSSSLGTLSVSSPPVAIGASPTVSSTAVPLPDSVTATGTGTSFSMTFPFSGGIPPFSWSLVSGTLPTGLTLNSQTGEIGGTPIQSGIFPLTLQVSDSLGTKSRKDWTLVVNEGIRSGWPKELQQRVGSGFLPESYSPVMADLDGNGKNEVIVADVSTLYVFYPDGTSRKTVLPGRVSTPAVADLDGDGRKEIIVSAGYHYVNSNTLYAFHNDLTPVSGFPAGAYSTYNDAPGFVSSPVVADFNGDGQVEIAVVATPNNINDSNYGKNVVILVGHQGQTVNGWPRIDDGAGWNDSPPAIGDIDRDGTKELVLAGSDGSIRIYKHDGTLLFQWQFDASTTDVWPPVLADMDGDGFLDVVVKYSSTANGPRLAVFSRTGTLLPGWPVSLERDVPVGPIIADMNDDGRPEIIVLAGAMWNELNLFQGDGTPLPGWPISISQTPSFDCHPVVADINGDGRQEIVLTTIDNSGNGQLLAYGADGLPVAGFPKYSSPASDIRSMAAIGDVDGNGRLDLVVKSENGFLFAWEMSQDGGDLRRQWPQFRADEQHSAWWVTDRLSLSPDPHTFPTVQTGASSSPYPITITNPLYEPVSLTSIALSGADSSMFSLAPGSCSTLPVSLVPLQSCTVNVSFAPSSAGTKNAVITATSISPGLVPTASSLTGTGILPQYTLTYTKRGSGSGTVTSSTGANYSTSGSETVAMGTIITLTAAPAGSMVFTGWEGACSGTGTCTITLDRDRQVIATFENPANGLYQLTINRNGPVVGSVSYSPGTICPGVCTRLYAAGSTVSLKPVLSTGARFTGWSGCDSVAGTTCSVTMNGAKAVTANFKSIAAVAAGYSHSAALREDGTVWAWGANYDGQLGIGTKTYSNTPVSVTDLAEVVALALGNSHSVALKADGTVWTWGDNGYGQLGDGTITDRTRPVQVIGLSGIVAISANYHSIALKEDGTVWAWGNNQYGQIGDGTTSNRMTPTQVLGLSGIVDITAGSYFSMALKADGTVWTWGNNSSGQLGNGTFTSRSVPAAIAGITGIVATSNGSGAHCFALQSTGTVWAWGNGYRGQIGNGSTAIWIKTPVLVPGLSGFTAFSVGSTHSMALTGTGILNAWGDNFYGQLGDGTTNQHATPGTVSGMTGVSASAGNEMHSVALKEDGTVWSWGYNGQGQLGDGTYTNRLTPVQVQNFNLDTTPPTATVTGTPSAPTTATGSTLTVGGSGVVTYKYKLGAGSYSAETPVATPIVLASLGEGTQTVSVIGRDAAGNWQVVPTVVSWLIDLSGPVTTVSPASGSYTSALNVTLSCDDGSGSGCAATRYCLGSGCTPATLYTGPISVARTTDLRYYSTDVAGNSETVKTAAYSITLVKVTVDGQPDRWYASLLDAFVSAPAAAAQHLYCAAGTFAEGIVMERCGEAVTVSGGFDAPFTTRVGKTYLGGTVRIRCGKLVADGLALR